jgi:hypothetical protein
VQHRKRKLEPEHELPLLDGDPRVEPPQDAAALFLGAVLERVLDGRAEGDGLAERPPTCRIEQ